MQTRRSVNLVGERQRRGGTRELARRSAARRPRARSRLPADTRLWAVLQDASGGTWGGCVFDEKAIGNRLRGV